MATAVAVGVAGYAALSAQTLLLRELMVAWRGNEMSFGLALAVWLLSTGAGGTAYAVVERRTRPGANALVSSLVVLAALSPASLIVARLARLAIGAPSGELAGVSQFLAAAGVSVVPFAFVSGFVFSCSISVMSSGRTRGAEVIGRAYVLEALGAVVAGALLSFLLLPHVDPVGTALMSASASAAAAALVSFAAPGAGASAARRVTLLTVAALLAVAVGPVSKRIDEASVAAQWRSLGFVSQANTVYGRIVTTRVGTQESVYESGVLTASAPDRMAAEEAVQITMLQHPAPRRVLMLGGCLGGAVDQVLEHPSVRSVDCIELDPATVSEARRWLGPEMTAGLGDPRVTLHYGDARFFVKRATGPYDVVIVSAPDPTTARLNRFYTLEFFEEVRATLAPGGVLGLSLSSADNYVSAELAAVLECVRNTLCHVFPNVLLTPGDPCHVLASEGDTPLTRDPALLSARVAERGLELAYVRDYYLADRFSADRSADLDLALSLAPRSLNTDLKPSGYYLSLLVWDRQLSGERRLLAGASGRVSVLNAALVSAALALLGLASLRRRSGGLRGPVFLSVFVVGLTEMSLEIASLMTYQSLYGYVYDRVAVIVAAFMAGLAVGGWLGRRAALRGAGAGSYLLLQAAIMLVPLGLLRAVQTVASLGTEQLVAWSNIFPLLVVGAALLAGVQFPLAAGLCVQAGSSPAATGGRLYGADLAGAAVGAPLTAVLLLPVLGLSGTMFSLSLLNAGALVALAVPAALRRSSAA